MRRRDLIAMGAAMALPFPVRAEPGGRRPLIGALFLGSNPPQTAAFLEGMHSLGYVQGQTFDLAYRFANGAEDWPRLPVLANELVKLKPDVIVVQEPQSALAAKQATSSIPIVGAILVDPVGAGLAASEARPGGNVTGILAQIPGLMGKQIDIVRELMPGASTLGAMVNPADPGNLVQWRDLEAAAKTAKVGLVTVKPSAKSDIEPAFETLTKANVQAVIVLKTSLLLSEAAEIAKLAVAAHLPTVGGDAQWADAGLLVSYGIDIIANFRRAAYFVDRIMKGTEPGDLPIEFPTKLALVLNLKTAKALGLAIPQLLMLQADRVIE